MRPFVSEPWSIHLSHSGTCLPDPSGASIGKNLLATTTPQSPHLKQSRCCIVPSALTNWPVIGRLHFAQSWLPADPPPRSPPAGLERSPEACRLVERRSEGRRE